mgnify:CR=1 FL=1
MKWEVLTWERINSIEFDHLSYVTVLRPRNLIGSGETENDLNLVFDLDMSNGTLRLIWDQRYTTEPMNPYFNYIGHSVQRLEASTNFKN